MYLFLLHLTTTPSPHFHTPDFQLHWHAFQLVYAVIMIFVKNLP